jgi:hypothetical protein
VYELVSKRQLNGAYAFQARLGGVPLGGWHATKQAAVRDILRCGMRTDVHDRTEIGPRIDRRALGWP